MSLIKQIARELAKRDVDEGFSPSCSIEELKTVLAGELLKAYGEAFEEFLAAKTLAPECGRPTAAETNLDVVSDGDRAALAADLNRGARGLLHLTPEILRACARAVTAPTIRELDLDEIAESVADTLTRIACGEADVRRCDLTELARQLHVKLGNGPAGGAKT